MQRKNCSLYNFYEWKSYDKHFSIEPMHRILHFFCMEFYDTLFSYYAREYNMQLYFVINCVVCVL